MAPRLDRLSTADLMMLRPEDVGWRQDIGAVGVLDGSALCDGHGAVRLDDIRRLVSARLPVVPRFREVLCIPRSGLGGPLWVDASEFDVARHVGVAPLGRDATEEDLRREVERLRRRPFDRSRPLWELWLLPGLCGERVGLYVKLHHTLADGVSGVLLLGAFLDATPEPDPVDPVPWTPAPPPTTGALLADSVRRKAAGAARSLAKLAHPIAAARAFARRWRDLAAVFRQRPVPATSVNQPIGEGRRLEFVRTSLIAVRDVGHRHGATVNDVLVAAVTGGYRALLVERGEPVDGVVLRASVPVSLHGEDPAGGTANNDAMMFVPLPVGVSDPAARLRAIATETADLKQHIRRPPSGPIMRNRLVQRWLWRQFDHQRWSNAYVANIPGPPDPLYLAGARLEEVFPIVPIMGNLTVGVGAMSYAGRFTITVVADEDSCPDVDVFVAGVRETLEALGAGTEALGSGAGRTAAPAS